MSEDFEGAVKVEYDKMLAELITNLYQERIKALAQGKVIAQKYNEVLKLNNELNIQLIKTQEQLSHSGKELEKLKRKTKNAKSKDISE